MPIQRWRCPVALQVKAVVFAAASVAVAGVFVPLWFGVPVMVVAGGWGLGVAVRRPEVVLDAEAGVLLLRVGAIARRVRLANVTAVLADEGKVSIARSDGGEISVYAWRKSPLDRWLRVPVVAGEVAHAISAAAAAAQAADTAGAGQPHTAGAGQPDGQPHTAGAGQPDTTDAAREAAPAAAGSAGAPQETGKQPGPAGPRGLAGRRTGRTGHAGRTGRPAWAVLRSRGPVAVLLLGCTGMLAVVAAFLVRIVWPNPVMTALGAVLALVLGVAGLCYVMAALWLLASGRVARPGKTVRDFPAHMAERSRT